MTTGKIALSISDDDEDVGYLTLPKHPGKGTPGAVRKQTRLLDLVKYVGPDIFLDFDMDGNLIGIEILA
jgi:uncharacterized protein YuzE